MNAPASERLGPSARKLLLRSNEDERVSSLVHVVASIDLESFRREVERTGGTIRSWLADTNLVPIEVGAGHLSALADLPGVVYVEAAQTYRY
jgi:hypothetical protein